MEVVEGDVSRLALLRHEKGEKSRMGSRGINASKKEVQYAGYQKGKEKEGKSGGELEGNMQ